MEEKIMEALSNSERPVIDDTELERRVLESKQMLSEPPKRRGGRPKKSDLPQSQGSPVGASLGPMLEVAIALPFEIAADRTGCKDLCLSKPEAKGLSDQADQVLRQYLPQLQGPEAVAVTFAVSLSVVTISKYLTYRQYVASLEAKAVTPTDGH